MNNYEQLAAEYARSHAKPDKKHSMAPTMLTLLAPLQGTTVIDVGCGDGFFTTSSHQQQDTSSASITLRSSYATHERRRTSTTSWQT